MAVIESYSILCFSAQCRETGNISQVCHNIHQHTPNTLPAAHKGCGSLIDSLEWLRVQSLDVFTLHVLVSDVN